MGIVSWLIIGLIVGGLGSLVLSGGDDGLPGGIALGMVGALLGGWLASALLGVRHPLGSVIVGTMLVAFLGAVVLVVVAEAVSGHRI